MKNRGKFFILIILLWHITKAQPIGTINRVLCAPKKNECRISNIKVKDVWPKNCDLEPNCNYLYPVLLENFDNNFDLPNIWSFRIDAASDDSYNASNEYWSTFVGDAYFDETNYPAPITNKNILLNNGILTLKLIPENITRNGRDYVASSGAITSFTRFRTGVFEARIKVPTSNVMWPAFWLFGKYGPYAEIDIFEFYDHNINLVTDPCNPYTLHKMSLHTGANNSHADDKGCTRDDTYPLNLNIWHTYKLEWDEYSIKIFVDGSFVARGFVTKYFRGNSIPVFPCLYGSSYNPIDALHNFNCESLALEPDNLLPTIPYIDFGPRPWYLPSYVQWPPPQPPQPYLANKVDESPYFPNKNSGMSLIISNVLNYKQKDKNLSAINPDALNMQIDWVKVYQPFCCGVDKTVCGLSDLDVQTYNSDILTGRKLTIGNNLNTCKFEQNFPGRYYNGTSGDRDWRDIPTIFLATDEIAINGDAIFPGNTYAEMRITDCGTTQRLSLTEQNELYAYNIENDSIWKSLQEKSNQKYDSIVNSYLTQYRDSVLNSYSLINFNDIVITPNPVFDYFNIIASEKTINRIKELTLVENSGKQFYLNVNTKINISNYQAGTYILKIILDDESIIYKKIIKN